MFDELGLQDVLKTIRRADEALTEFVAPLWPGVSQAVAWMDGRPRLFRLTETPVEEGYFLCGTRDGDAFPLRLADRDEAHRYRGLLESVTLIMLADGLAYPASFAERLQGITAPRPLHFAPATPLARVAARFDGVNLFYDGEAATQNHPLAELFSDASIFTPGELLDVPGQGNASESAEAALADLTATPELSLTYRLQAIVGNAGGIVEDWARTDDGYRVQWRRLEEEHTVMLTTPNSPITSGICLPGARGFDLPALTHLLLEHVLDAWRA